MNESPPPTSLPLFRIQGYCLVRKNHTLIHVQGLLNLVHTTYPTLYEQSDYTLIPSWIPHVFSELPCLLLYYIYFNPSVFQFFFRLFHRHMRR